MRALIEQMRNPNLSPCKGILYGKDLHGQMNACIDGVINEMAINNGVPSHWIELEDAVEDYPSIWEAEQPDRNGAEPFGIYYIDPSNTAIPEAVLYHGMSIVEGKHLVDVFNCDPQFVRDVINKKYETSFGTKSTAKLNDIIFDNGANPLLMMADILEHLLDKPYTTGWHDRIRAWHQ